MPQTFETWYRSTLATKLSSSDITITVATAPTVTAGRMHIYKWSTHAWIKFTGVSGTTLTGVTFVSQTTDPATTVTGTTFPAGTAIELVEMHDQKIDKVEPTYLNQIATTYATTATRDAALGADWIAAYPYTDIYVTATGLYYNYNTVSAIWEAQWTSVAPTTTIVGEIRMWSGTSAPTSWFLCDGTAVSRTTYSALFAITGTLYGVGDGSTTFNLPNFSGRVAVGIQSATSIGTATITIASPGVITKASHGLADGDKVYFTTTGALPTGITASTEYFVVNSTTSTFQISNTFWGTAINTSGSQSGTHTLFSANFNNIGDTGGEVNHTISTAEMPSHSHNNITSYSGWWATSCLAIQTGINAPSYSSTYQVESTWWSKAHNNLQPFLTVNYIIKY